MKDTLALSALVVASALLAGCKHFQSVPVSAAESAAAFDSRSLNDPGLREIVEKIQQPDSGLTVSARASWPPTQWDFPTLTLVAFYFHPSLDLARAQWNVARAGVKTAGARPNPIVGILPGYNFNPVSGVSPWIPTLNYDIPIETAGKRGHRLTRAGHLSEVARLSIAIAAWQVRSNLRLSLLDAAAARRRSALAQSQAEIQQQIVRMLEQRLAAGAVSAPEVIPARVALVRGRADLAEAKRLATEARGRIAEALGLPARAIEGAEFKFELNPDFEAGKDLTSSEVRREVLRSRPDILGALADYAASQSALELEIAKQYPDLRLGGSYQWDQGENKWLLGVTMELPVLNRNEGPIAEAEAKRTEAAARFTALQARAIAEIDRSLTNRLAVQEQLRQIENLVATQRQQLQSIQTAFEAGGADQLELKSAQLEAGLSELAQLDAQVRWQQSLGQLEDAFQRPFAALSSVEQGRKVEPKKQKQ